MPVPEVIRQLREAGLDSIPGGGGEILVDAIRERVAAQEGADRGVARGAGGGPPAGHEDLGHDDVRPGRDRRRPDRAPLPRARGAGPHRRLHRLHLLAAAARGHAEMSHMPKTDAVTYLRTLAMARIVLDNVPNLQSSWVTMGHKVGQVALRFGANDYGSLMMEENVVSAAGTTYRTTLAEIERIITRRRLRAGAAAPGLFADRVASTTVGVHDTHRASATTPIASRRAGRSSWAGQRIRIPEGLVGHSDADAVAHALTDALLGAAGAGEHRRAVSRHRSRWKDADSIDAAARGGRAGRAARVAPARRPTSPSSPSSRRSAPHAGAMAAAHRGGARASRRTAWAIKGKTNEGMGFIGRGRGHRGDRRGDGGGTLIEVDAQLAGHAASAGGVRSPRSPGRRREHLPAGAGRHGGRAGRIPHSSRGHHASRWSSWSPGLRTCRRRGRLLRGATLSAGGFFATGPGRRLLAPSAIAVDRAGLPAVRDPGDLHRPAPARDPARWWRHSPGLSICSAARAMIPMACRIRHSGTAASRHPGATIGAEWERIQRPDHRHQSCAGAVGIGAIVVVGLFFLLAPAPAARARGRIWRRCGAPLRMPMRRTSVAAGRGIRAGARSARPMLLLELACAERGAHAARAQRSRRGSAAAGDSARTSGPPAEPGSIAERTRRMDRLASSIVEQVRARARGSR